MIQRAAGLRRFLTHSPAVAWKPQGGAWFVYAPAAASSSPQLALPGAQGHTELPFGTFAVLGFGFGAAWISSVSMPRNQSGVVRAAVSQDELKKQVGYKAVDDYVKSGMVVGLGTGSTAAFAVERVGELLKDGTLKDIIAIPTSIRTKEQAESLGIPLATLDTHSNLDVAIDGADEVDPQLNLVKGGGGALFREKIVEKCAKKFIVIVDESKLCDGLGPGFPVPVEIVPFCHEHTMRVIAKLPALEGCEPVLRLGNIANNKCDGDKP